MRRTGTAGGPERRSEAPGGSPAPADTPAPRSPGEPGGKGGERPPRVHRPRRETYIDAFRGVMALIMVQGHVCERLLSKAALADPLYQLQLLFHGSTAPGFLFASGFVAGLPRAPLSARASLRRARRLLFILGVAYTIHLPYLSIWKTLNEAIPVEWAALWACDALQVIAVTQLFVIALQWVAGTRWIAAAAVLTLAILAAGPGVWAGGVSSRLMPALGAYLSPDSGSTFPVFPFSAFVLGGTVAGAAIGRQDPGRRHGRALWWGIGLLAAGGVLAVLLRGFVDFWGASPAYVLVRLGGLLLMLRLVETLADRQAPGITTLALLGHETLLVYVLHLYFLYGGIIGVAPLNAYKASLGFVEVAWVFVAMLPVLLAAAWAWHAAKMRAPHEAALALAFLTVAFVWEFLTRPW